MISANEKDETVPSFRVHVKIRDMEKWGQQTILIFHASYYLCTINDSIHKTVLLYYTISRVLFSSFFCCRCFFKWTFILVVLCLNMCIFSSLPSSFHCLQVHLLKCSVQKDPAIIRIWSGCLERIFQQCYPLPVSFSHQLRNVQ